MVFFSKKFGFDRAKFLAVAIDFLSMLAIFGIIMRTYNYIASIMASIPPPELLLTMPYEQMSDIMSADPALRIKIALIAAVISIFLIVILGRAAVWQMIAGRITLKGWLIGSGAALAWSVSGFFLAFLVWMLLRSPFNDILLYPSLFLLIHTTIAISAGLAKEQSWIAIKTALKESFTKIHRFLLIYMMVFAAFLIGLIIHMFAISMSAIMTFRLDILVGLILMLKFSFALAYSRMFLFRLLSSKKH